MPTETKSEKLWKPVSDGKKKEILEHANVIAQAEHFTLHKCPNRVMSAPINYNFHSQANLGNGKYRYRYKCDREARFKYIHSSFYTMCSTDTRPWYCKGNLQNHYNR